MKYGERPLEPGLYFVATPIGNARDITLRALDILASAGAIAAEDTRTARKLMDIHGIPLAGRPIVAYHDHSSPADRDRVLGLLREGRAVAYVSEAGTPLVADPGFALGRAAQEAGFMVTTAPGPSAALAALSLSGLPSDRFQFVGFLPSGKAQRETELAGLRDVAATMIFFESPKRVGEMLASCAQILGEGRQAAVCRELTKKFEEVRRGSLQDLAQDYDGTAVKGEIVVVIGHQGATAPEAADVKGALREAMKTMRVKDAANAVAGALGLPKRQVYQLALEMESETE